MRPGGDDDATGVPMQAGASDHHAVRPAGQPVSPSPDQTRTPQGCGCDQPHHPARIVKEGRVWKERRPAHAGGQAGFQFGQPVVTQKLDLHPKCPARGNLWLCFRKSLWGLVEIETAPALQDGCACDLERKVIPPLARVLLVAVTSTTAFC